MISIKTYGDIYIAARKVLKEQGIEAYDLEARLIVAKAAGKSVAEFLRDQRLFLTDNTFEQTVIDMLKRRVLGEPVAYITGAWEFYGVELNITPSVLIPRTDTEKLVEVAVNHLKKQEAGRRVLDLCCGSGCIGIALCSQVLSARVVMADISSEALSCARSNVLKNSETKRITCLEADALNDPPMFLGKYDMIISNPPYIPSEDILTLDNSVKDYEPMSALDGGGDGLKFYRSIAKKWSVILEENGCLMFEVGIGQAQAVRDILNANGFGDIRIYKDTGGIDRVVTGILKNTGGQ